MLSLVSPFRSDPNLKFFHPGIASMAFGVAPGSDVFSDLTERCQKGHLHALCIPHRFDYQRIQICRGTVSYVCKQYRISAIVGSPRIGTLGLIDGKNDPIPAGEGFSLSP